MSTLACMSFKQTGEPAHTALRTTGIASSQVQAKTMCARKVQDSQLLTLSTVGLGGTAAILRPSMRATLSSRLIAFCLSEMCCRRATDTELRCAICCPAASTRAFSCEETPLSCAASAASAACTSSSTVSAAGLLARRARRASSCCRGALQGDTCTCATRSARMHQSCVPMHG